jgi:site-specific DNA-cytosine methylase
VRIDELIPAHKNARSGNFNDRFREQVGNAVPPLLARQIAEVVYDLIKKSVSKI